MIGTGHTGWPFWAGTSDEHIDRALSLAAVRPGERLVDLGCGDGRVLLRAATVHGAVVAGVEVDPSLVASARALLAAYGVAGTVTQGDFESTPIESDVVFAYLSPATLQRLRPLLGACAPGTRLVTTGYPVPGWEADDRAGRCYLYRLPAPEAPIDRQARGWASAGVLISLRPDAPSLVAVKLHHRGGPVAATVSGAGFRHWVTVRTGADTADAGDEVVVDMRFDPRPIGTLAAGGLDVTGEAPLRIFAAVDDGDPGVWGLDVSGCQIIGRALAGGDAASVLSAARQSHRGRPQNPIV